MRTWTLPFVLALLTVAGCGGDTGDPAQEASAPPSTAPSTTPSTTPSTAPSTASTAPLRTGPLANRDRPLAVGEVAPAFEGRPEGKAILLFYRGHW